MKTFYVFYCLLYATWTEGVDIHEEGFEWGVLSFQCSHNFAWKNNKYFCKDPCKTNEDILVTVKSGGRAEAERIRLVDSGNGVFYVTFNPLHLSDAGRYWCAVDRPGFDTFTAVYLTVKEAVANDTTTVILDVSSTWTYQNISSSTPLISQMDTSTNASIASNFTDGGKNSISASTVLYATAGAVIMLTILVVAMSFRKCRKKQKQQQVCSNSTDHVSNREADCERGETGEEVRSIKNLSEKKQDPPTSASTAADCSVPFHIYENICCDKDTAYSNYSARNIQDKHDASPRIYIKPLPPIISQRPGDDCLRKHTNKESCTSKVLTCHSRSCCDSAESRPRSLWFGLDLSGTI
ncbi:CMRF35-like molecule 1 [Thunnus maccoyii]|uniref:CMRF35-like molecule 1 n=1 Tax=Thunnus maccoyii TaxID=8240 RepID=UPI001C4DD1D7|nr:CMRF35-like molecule 1 [Thunnus maccoyii]